MVDPFMGEHLEAVRVVRAGGGERAGAAMVTHLDASRDKAANRLRRFHEGYAITSRHLMTGEPLAPGHLRARSALCAVSCRPSLRCACARCIAA